MGILRGYDVRSKLSPFKRQSAHKSQVYLNIVLDDANEEKANGERVPIGMVVIRGNAVVLLEALDRINIDMPKIGR